MVRSHLRADGRDQDPTENRRYYTCGLQVKQLVHTQRIGVAPDSQALAISQDRRLPVARGSLGIPLQSYASDTYTRQRAPCTPLVT